MKAYFLMWEFFCITSQKERLLIRIIPSDFLGIY